MRLRIPFSAISVFGLGALVAVPLAIALYLGGAASVRSAAPESAVRLELGRMAGGAPVQRRRARIARPVDPAN